MELIPISCHHCGAPLHIPPQTDLVTCQHCLTQLAVRRNESVAWTEKLDEIDERTDQLRDSVAWLYFQRELENVDRGWLGQQQSWQRADSRRRNSADTFFGWGIVVIAVCLAVLVVLSESGSILAGLCLGTLGLVGLIVALFENQARHQARLRRLRAALRYSHNRELAKRLYEQQRADLQERYFPTGWTTDEDCEEDEYLLVDISEEDSEPVLTIQL